MFELKESINIPNTGSEVIFEKVSSKTDDFLEEFSLKDPKVVRDSVDRKFRIHAENFKGEIFCQENRLEIHLDFQSLFDIRKEKAQKHLDQWIQSVLSSTYDM